MLPLTGHPAEEAGDGDTDPPAPAGDGAEPAAVPTSTAAASTEQPS